MIYKWIIITAYLLYECFAMNIIFQSGGENKTLSEVPICSCQLPAVSVHNKTFTLYIQQIPQYATNITIQFEKLGYEKQFLPVSEIKLLINADKYPLNKQITQMIHVDINGITITRQLYIVNTSDSHDVDWISLPKSAIIVTQLIAISLILILPRNIYYRRFKPITFNIIFAIIYGGIVFVGIYLSMIIKQGIPQYRYAIAFISFVFGYLYIQDLLSIFIQKKCVLDCISILLITLIVLVDLTILEDAWFINTLIAILFAGTITKFIIIRKLKHSIIPLSILWLFFIIRKFAMMLQIQTLQDSLQLELIPLFIQIPALFQTQGYICSAFATSKLISFTIILNYAIRIDIFLSTKFYEIVLSILAIVCLIIEVSLDFLLDDLPSMEFFGIIIFYPISIMIIFFFSKKRGQWEQIWHGNFYDLSVNGINISKSQSLLIEDDYGQSLKVNGSLQ